MEKKKELYLSGPVFISRLEGKNSVIYNISDIHHPLEEQTECPLKKNSLYIHQHLYKLFKSQNKNKYNFYLETHCSYGEYFYSNTDTMIYINQVRKLFHDFLKEKNRKNVNLVAFDERLNDKSIFSKYSMSCLELAMFSKVLLIIAILIFVSSIILFVLHKLQKTEKSENPNVVLIFLSMLSLVYILYYVFSLSRKNEYKKQFLEVHTENKYTKIINNSKHVHVKKEYKTLIDYLANHENVWQEFLCCTYIIDLWCIDNILNHNVSGNKDIDIIYAGLSHSDHIMFFLINKYNYKVTQTSDNNSNTIKHIMGLSRSYDIEKIIVNSEKSHRGMSYIQCSDISKFPPNEFHVQS